MVAEPLILRVLELLRDHGPLGPGDAVAATGAPRYRVLAAFHCLEELGLARKIYERGTYKVYQISMAGEALLDAARSSGLAGALEEALLALRQAQAVKPHSEARAQQEAP